MLSYEEWKSDKVPGKKRDLIASNLLKTEVLTTYSPKIF